jgi:molybdate transport system regulatory protein
MSETPLVSLKIRLKAQDAFAFGPGKADLLEAIGRTRSIAAAGRELGLSYWKTRHLLDEMAQCFRWPVVVAAKGGEKGGGARLTEAGERALALFRAMEKGALEAIREPAEAFQDLLR